LDDKRIIEIDEFIPSVEEFFERVSGRGNFFGGKVLEKSWGVPIECGNIKNLEMAKMKDNKLKVRCYGV